MEANFKFQNKDSVAAFLKESNLEFIEKTHDKAVKAEHAKTLELPSESHIYPKLMAAEGKDDAKFFILLHPNTNGKLSVLEKSLKAKKLRNSGAESLAKLGISQETLNPLALLNDSSKSFKLAVDMLLKDTETLYFHPFDDCSTFGLNKESLFKLLSEGDVIVDYIDFAKKEEKPKAEPKKKAKKEGKHAELSQNKKSALLGITVGKEENFAKWYTEVITKAKLIDYYDISGCYILRPPSFSIWESITEYFNVFIKSKGVQNAYFPMFVTEDVLKTEESHIEGFSPEVAWVTHYGDSKLEKKVAIRPTSETIMYPCYAKWIKTYRDLPLKLNQWCNVVRWEFKDPTPFLRTREFLWQEGHTAHETKECMKETVFEILEGYRQVFEELLAVPVTKGIKTKSEQFPGADFSSSIEGFICESGRGIQCGTSHGLGQNFSKMFKIQYLDKNNEKQFAWQSSWGISTRSIGSMIMTHGDDKGLVMPPKVATIQVVVIPFHNKAGDKTEVSDSCQELVKDLQSAGIRTEFDGRDQLPGFKFNDWELKGTPIRIELGKKEKDQGKLTVNCRDQFGEKIKIDREGSAETIKKMLDDMQMRMLENAKKKVEARKIWTKGFDDSVAELKKKNMVVVDWCGEMSCEEDFIERAKKEAEDDEYKLDGLKTLCIPLEYHEVKDGNKCFNCEKEMLHKVIFGKSY